MQVDVEYVTPGIVYLVKEHLPLGLTASTWINSLSRIPLEIWGIWRFVKHFRYGVIHTESRHSTVYSWWRGRCIDELFAEEAIRSKNCSLVRRVRLFLESRQHGACQIRLHLLMLLPVEWTRFWTYLGVLSHPASVTIRRLSVWVGESCSYKPQFSTTGMGSIPKHTIVYLSDGLCLVL